MIGYDSPKGSLWSAQITQKIDNVALLIELKISFIVLDCLSKTHSSGTLYKTIVTLFKYFKKVAHTVLESVQASGLIEVEENDVQKQLRSISEQ